MHILLKNALTIDDKDQKKEQIILQQKFRKENQRP